MTVPEAAGPAAIEPDTAGPGTTAPGTSTPDAPALARHRLQLPRATPPAAVLAMVANVLPDAAAGPEAIDLGEGARLIADPSPRRAGRWTLLAPRLRDSAPSDHLPDSHGYGRAFPDGIPYGRERDLLDLLWSLARRLDGAVVTDTGVRLEPHPFAVRDLIVVSPNPLVAEDLLRVVQSAEPDARVILPPAQAGTTGYVIAVPLALREQGSGLAVSADPSQILAAEEREDDELHVRVGPSERPAALAALPWLRRAVDYRIVHVLADEEEDALELPDPDVAARWEAAHERAGLVAAAIIEAVGGHVVDLEGFLVDPADLV